METDQIIKLWNDCKQTPTDGYALKFARAVLAAAAPKVAPDERPAFEAWASSNGITLEHVMQDFTIGLDDFWGFKAYQAGRADALPPAGSIPPWSTRPESNTITLNYSFASAILGALFNGPTFNPTAHERIKQDFAAVMRGDKLPHAQQTKCEWDQGDPESTEWHTGCGSHWIFNEGGPEENSMIFCHGCGKPIAITSPKGDAR